MVQGEINRGRHIENLAGRHSIRTNQRPPRPSVKLQWVLYNAARLSGTSKYDSELSQILHADLHWLDVADWVWYKLGVTVHRCLHNKALQYLFDCCVPVSDIVSSQRLRSARRCLLTVPHHLAVGHSQLPDPLSGTCFQNNSETPTALSLHSDSHSRHPSSTSISVFSALEVFKIMRYINPHFTYFYLQYTHS